MSDKSFKERLAYFLEEVKNEEGYTLDDKTRYLAILAVLMGAGGYKTFSDLLDKTLKDELSVVEVKELIYQAHDYLGIARAEAFLDIANEVIAAKGLKDDTETMVTTIEDRLKEGVKAQVSIFGEGMKDAYKASVVNRYLAANCFGDYYTRKGLDLRQREMITFCFLLAQGGVEPQLISHARGNIAVGNDKEFLMSVIIQCLPYIGYPRSLNAISALEKATV